MELEDTLWDILDAVRLGDFFDEYDIPPIVFPIAVIAVIALLFFLLTPTGPALAECGDAVCSVEQGENCAICPPDCICQAGFLCRPTEPGANELGCFEVGTELKERTVEVSITGDPCEGMEVLLYDENGDLIGKQTGAKSVFTFADVKAENAYAVIESPSGKTKASEPIALTASKNIIEVTLPNFFCLDENNYGSINVRIEDSQTGALLTAKVTMMTDNGVQKAVKTVANVGLFENLLANKYYYVIVEKDGYRMYNGESQKIYVKPKETAERIVKLDPIPGYDNLTQGEFEVCVKGDEDECIEHGGIITVFTADGEAIKTGNLDQCPLFRGMATSEGCFVFGIQEGLQVYAAVTHAPPNCSTSQNSEVVLIEQGKKKTVFLEVVCGNITIDGVNVTGVGEVRVIVFGEDDKVLTENVTITLWEGENDTIIPGSSGNELEVMGNFTETVPVPVGTKVYAIATPKEELAPFYIETRSRKKKVEPDEPLILDIQLDEVPVPKPPLDAYVTVDPLKVELGTNVTVVIYNVTLEDESVTENASATCSSSWGEEADATYMEETDSLVCELNTTVLGEHTVSFEVTHPDGEPFADAVDITVVSYAEGELTLTRQAADTLTSPAVLRFLITNETGDPVTSLSDSNVTTWYSATGGLISKNLKLTSAGEPGIYQASIPVPFVGDYESEIVAEAMVDFIFIDGSTFVTFPVEESSDATLVGTLSEVIMDPGASLDVSAQLLFQSRSIPDQDIMAYIVGEENLPEFGLIWDAEDLDYKATIEVPSKECAYNISFYVLQDPSINDTKTFYVAAVGDEEDCPLPSACENLTHVKGCRALGMSVSEATLLTCAEEGMDTSTCGIREPVVEPWVPPPEQDCTIPFSFKVKVSAETESFDNSWAHYAHRDNNKMYGNWFMGSEQWYYIKPEGFSAADTRGDPISDKVSIWNCIELPWATDPSLAIYHDWRTWVKMDSATAYDLQVDGLGSLAVFLDGNLLGTFTNNKISCPGSLDDYHAFTLNLKKGWNRIDITMTNWAIQRRESCTKNPYTGTRSCNDVNEAGPFLTAGLKLKETLSNIPNIADYGGSKAITSTQPSGDTGGGVTETSERFIFPVSSTEGAKTLAYELPGFDFEDESFYRDTEYILMDPIIASVKGSGERTVFAVPRAGVIEIDDEDGTVTATASCPLACGQSVGDLNADDLIDDADIAILEGILGAIQMAGAPPYEDMSCLDINDDDHITQEDVECLQRVKTGQPPTGCADCSPSLDMELCGNSIDDDCDGQIDADGYDEEAGELYGDYGDDLCACTENTPCEMTDLTGKVCARLAGGPDDYCTNNFGEYMWLTPEEARCDAGKAGCVKYCGGRSFTCAQAAGLDYEWQEI